MLNNLVGDLMTDRPHLSTFDEFCMGAILRWADVVLWSDAFATFDAGSLYLHVRQLWGIAWPEKCFAIPDQLWLASNCLR